MEPTTHNTSTVSFHVTNCDARSAAFIAGIVGLFCDPGLDNIVNEIKAGKLAIDMDPSDGQPCVFDPRLPRAPRCLNIPVSVKIKEDCCKRN